MTKYFILLRHPKGFPLPIMNDDDIIMLFDSEEDAEKCAQDNSFAEAFGYEILEWAT